jgi:hypothetical protein
VPQPARPDARLEMCLHIEEEFPFDERWMHARQQFSGPSHIEVANVERIPQKMRETAQVTRPPLRFRSPRSKRSEFSFRRV